MRILIVDDEPNIRKTLRVALESLGAAVQEAASVAEAVKRIERCPFDLAIVDLRLGQDSGFHLLEAAPRQSSRFDVVIMTAYATIDNAVDAMRRGAIDYLPKPFTPAQIRAVVERVERVRGLFNRLTDLEDQLGREIPEISLESPDAQVRRVLEQARQVAATDAVVLIRGESGTGKGVLARAIHASSKRASNLFVTVSCPSLSAELLESDLFGHARGAFTGAVAETQGKVAAAKGGTLFLDEIGDLPLPLQPKLLRFLQEKCYERVGESQTRTADVRLVAATNRDLESAVAAGQFRDDLLFRLNVVELVLPPLRTRADRIELAEHLLAFFARQVGKKLEGFAPDARIALLAYAWPGNLRELRNAIERAVIFARGPMISPDDLPERVARSRDAHPGMPAPRLAIGEPLTLDQLEAEHIRVVIERSGSLDDAARTLGIDPSTLYRKRKQLNL